MIKPGEIQQKARKLAVRDQQIEKDYILSWILFGISKNEQLSKTLAFKGGTVLKKAYFEDYRFSEDLDFTMLDHETDYKTVIGWFKKTFEFIKEEANIPLEFNTEEIREEENINFHIGYVGPLGGQGSNKKVKVDISRNEKLVFDPVLKNIFIDYSDIEKYQLLCYSLEEVLIEKMRSIMQRMQARDFYDLWYLLVNHEIYVEFYVNEFIEKCKNKGLQAADFHRKIIERLPQYKGRWQSSLKEQINELPEFDKVERETLKRIKKLKI